MEFSRRVFVGGAVTTLAGVTASAVIAAPDKKVLPVAEVAPPKAPATPKAADMPPLLKEALAALDRHDRRVGQRDRIGLVDFTEHSSKKRFQLVDVASGASYVDSSLIHSQGQIGRSLGCFSVEQSEIAAVLDKLGEGRLLYASDARA